MGGVEDSSALASASTLTAAMEEEEEITLAVKWSGKEYTVRVCGDDTIGELKRRICQLTNVLPKRQKLLYPKLLASKLSVDSTLLSHLSFKPSLKMTMIGTVEDDIIVDQVDSPEIVDDFELGQDEAVDIKDKDVNKQKLRRRIDQYKTTPSTSLSSHAGAEDGLYMSDLDHSVSIGSVGMWVTPAEAEHARTLTRVYAEQIAENKLMQAMLQARLYLSEDRVAAAHSMSDKLAERVADLSELAAERGQLTARAWKLIKWLIAALVISFAFALAVAFK